MSAQLHNVKSHMCCVHYSRHAVEKAIAAGMHSLQSFHQRLDILISFVWHHHGVLREDEVLKERELMATAALKLRQHKVTQLVVWFITQEACRHNQKEDASLHAGRVHGS